LEIEDIRIKRVNLYKEKAYYLIYFLFAALKISVLVRICFGVRKELGRYSAIG